MASKVMKTVKKTAQEVVTNKYVLYTLLFLAILNVLALLGTNNFVSLAVFGLVGLLTSYFTKNMVIILLVTLIVSSFLHITKRTVEAMTNKKPSAKKGDNKGPAPDMAVDEVDDAAEVSDDESDNEEHEAEGSDEPVMKKSKSALNHQATVQESYNNIHSILGNKNFKKMTKDTNKLLEQQNKLTESLNNMAPILKSAESMLGQFDMEKMTGMLDSLNFGADAGKKKKN
jgi:hypothetical protein